ncbi:translation protein SH3-like domain-containing protein [Apiosordaria backusii]|uniref:Translation protein SH3-like domain-containing protein n=1 Tax=Apiosordaria backusii TaxID=314023 RepID=A0AA40F016_9PEZI|nr:translation protein SH3-like domain-containing protein [Apiosordaria backusii]
MNAAPLARRPLSCLKSGLRQARQQKIFSRSMATRAAATPKTPSQVPDHNFYRLVDKKSKTLRSAFAIYPPTQAAAGIPLTPVKTTNPVAALHDLQIKKLDPTGARTALFARTREAAKVGDILLVTHRRGGEPFAGVCLSIRRAGIDTAVLLRNHLGKVGVEMWFKIYNRNVAGIEIVKRRLKRARRARLTYMRKPKHDMGSVAEYVSAWRKSRRVFQTKGRRGRRLLRGRMGRAGGRRNKGGERGREVVVVVGK